MIKNKSIFQIFRPYYTPIIFMIPVWALVLNGLIIEFSKLLQFDQGFIWSSLILLLPNLSLAEISRSTGPLTLSPFLFYLVIGLILSYFQRKHNHLRNILVSILGFLITYLLAILLTQWISKILT